MFDLTLESARLAVIGLGYVGLPLAVAFGKAMPVVAFDINAARIAALQAGHDATLEVDDDELATARQLTYSSAVKDMAGCNVYIVGSDPDRRPQAPGFDSADQSLGNHRGGAEAG